MAAPVVTKPELIEAIVGASETEVSAKQVKSVLEAFTDTVYDYLAEGRRVRLPQLVTLEYRVSHSKAIKKGTMVRNPSTGETFPHKGRGAVTKVVAKASVPKVLKDHVSSTLSVPRAKKLVAPAAPAKPKAKAKKAKRGKK